MKFACAALVGLTGLTGLLAFHSWLGAQLRADVAFATSAGSHAAATVVFLWLVRRVLSGDFVVTAGLAFGVAAAMRLVCLVHEPTLSDDVWRYVHEGRMVLAGENPYLTAPADVAEGLRGPHHERINNPDIPAAYPPAVQYGLAAGAAIGAGPFGMRLVFGGFDMLVFLLLWLGLPAIGVRREFALIYGWCPLPALEFAGQAHSDSLAIAFTVLAVLAGTRERWLLAGAALGVATAGKLIPIVLLPFVLRRAGNLWPEPRALVLGAVAFTVTLGALYAPFVADGMFEGTTQYVGRWRSNDTLFAGIHWLAERIVAAELFSPDASEWFRESQRVAKFLLAGLTLIVLAVCWWRRLSPWAAGLVFFAWFLVAAPTVHPWYVAFLVPFLCVRPSLLLLAFTGAVFLAYHVLPAWRDDKLWQEITWLKVVEYIPLYAGLPLLLSGRSPDESEPLPAE